MVAQKVMASTREAYGKTLIELAEENPDIVVLGGDLNVSVFTHLWRAQYPDRFFEVGPAEQNIIVVALVPQVRQGVFGVPFFNGLEQNHVKTIRFGYQLPLERRRLLGG